MKRNIFVFTSLILTGLIFGSCKKFLDVTPTDRITSEVFPADRLQADAALTGIYNSLLAANVYGGTSALEMDAATPNAYSYDNRNGVNFIAMGIQDASNSTNINNKWGQCYEGIGRANVLIAKIYDIQMDDVAKKKIAAEAKFLRALLYFQLITHYGDVPLILNPPNLEEQGAQPRNTYAEVYAQIVKDCNEAITDLPLNSDSKQRASQGVALALKARAMLYNSDFSGAATASKQIITNNNYKLFSSYRDLFQLENEGNSEVIFDIGFKYPEFGSGYDIQLTDFNSFAPLKDLLDDYYMSDGKPAVSSPLYDPSQPYANRDPRLNFTLILPGTTFRGVVVPANKFGSTGVGQKKYTVYKDDVAAATIPEGQSQINYQVFRYGEILLMYAEAQNEVSGPDQSVYDAINALRARVNMPELAIGLTKEQMRAEIRHERRIELAGEGLYYYDIRRWKTAEVVNNGTIYKYDGTAIVTRKFDKGRDYLFPIPTVVRDRNGSLSQNPGY